MNHLPTALSPTAPRVCGVLVLLWPLPVPTSDILLSPVFPHALLFFLISSFPHFIFSPIMNIFIKHAISQQKSNMLNSKFKSISEQCIWTLNLAGIYMRSWNFHYIKFGGVNFFSFINLSCGFCLFTVCLCENRFNVKFRCPPAPTDLSLRTSVNLVAYSSHSKLQM